MDLFGRKRKKENEERLRAQFPYVLLTGKPKERRGQRCRKVPPPSMKAVGKHKVTVAGITCVQFTDGHKFFVEEKNLGRRR